jgi:excisionase family DNA binding protein
MTDRLLNSREIGELLGFSPATVVDWAEAGNVPAFKVGGRLRFRESEVLAWLETKRAPGEATPVTTPTPAGCTLGVTPVTQEEASPWRS